MEVNAIENGLNALPRADIESRLSDHTQSTVIYTEKMLGENEEKKIISQCAQRLHAEHLYFINRLSPTFVALFFKLCHIFVFALTVQCFEANCEPLWLLYHSDTAFND